MKLLHHGQRLLALIFAVAFAGVAAAQDTKDGWVNLLEGKDLTKNWTTTGNWILGDDGVVALKPRKGESGWERYDAYLWAKKQYQDFEAEFEYKVDKGGNSGFYFHVGDLKNPVAKGIEVQIYDSGNRPKDPKKLNDHDSGGIIPGIPPTKNTAKLAGEWNKMKVICQGKKVTVYLNDEVVNEVQLDHAKIKDRPPTGYIGFQDHGLPLWLRNIRVRELKSNPQVLNVPGVNFQRDIVGSKIPVVVYFWASWCGPCNKFNPTFEKLAVAHQGRVKFCKVDVDAEEELAKMYQITGIPTIVILKEGKLVEEPILGISSEEALTKVISKVLQ
jgi:thioredoxin